LNQTKNGVMKLKDLKLINNELEIAYKKTYLRNHMRALANRFIPKETFYNSTEDNNVPMDLHFADRYEIARVRFTNLNKQLIRYGLRECYLKIYKDTCSRTKDFLCIYCQNKMGVKNAFKLPD